MSPLLPRIALVALVVVAPSGGAAGARPPGEIAGPISAAVRATLDGEIAARGRTVALVRLRSPAPRARRRIDRDHLAAVAAAEARFAATLDPVHARVRRGFATFAAALVELDADGLRAVVAHPDVARLAPDLPTRPSLAESVPAIRADVTATAGYVGAGVGVAVLDTGINAAHTDLADAVIAPGYHALGQGQDVGPGDTDDDSGHGTNVAAIIASRGRAGAAGVAPGARVLAVKVHSAEGGWASDWALGLDWLAAHHGDFDVPVRVVNLSLSTDRTSTGCPCDEEAGVLAEAAQAARDAGLVLVAAAGNRGLRDELPLPACFSSVLAVGATYDAAFGRAPEGGTYRAMWGSGFAACFDDTAPRRLACFSNRGACVRLVAPGAAITAASIDGPTSLYTLFGTSQAAPHVAGVAALVRAAFPALGPDDVEIALLGSRRPAVEDEDGAAYPSLDAPDALARAACAACEPASPCLDARCGDAGCEPVPRPAGTACGVPSCERGAITTHRCDGAGACVAATTSCGAYTCDPARPACLDACTADDSCAAGLACRAGACVAPTMTPAGGCGCAVGARPENARGALLALGPALLAGAGLRRGRRRVRDAQAARISSSPA